MSNPNYTARGFTLRIKSCLADHGLKAEVKSQTQSFSGFGYGSACTAEVRLEGVLPESAKFALAAIQKEFRESDGGPKFSEKQKAAFSISLAGPAYPCGGKVA
jgi:hypothetical protein